MNYTLTDQTLTLYLTGRIDAANAPKAEEEITACCQQHPAAALVLDLENLDYISSAGLRVILRLRKKYQSISLTGANSEVYDILDMTGFTEMMPVQKGYRRLSVDGCEVIGQGANGVVYRLDADTIVKVYRNPDSLPDIKRERELARKAFIMGIPTAIPYDVAKVGDSYGSVFELLNAKSFVKLIHEDPSRFDEYVRLSVDLLKKIHSTQLKPGEMPDQHQVAMRWAEYAKDYLPSEDYAKLIKLLTDLPQRYTMLHGDYHMKNIMQQNGETLLIDMDTLSLGHPVFEFAQIYSAYVGYGEINVDQLTDFMDLSPADCHRIWHDTLALYFGDEETCRRMTDKARLIAYLRIMRRTLRRHGDPAMVEHSRKNLIALLKTVDSLDF